MPARTTHPTVTLREKIAKKGTRLYLDIYHAGERRRQSLPLLLTGDRFVDQETRRRGELIRRQVEQELLGQGVPKPVEVPTVIGAIEAAVARGLISNRRVGYGVRGHALRVYGDALTVDRLTDVHLREFLVAIREKLAVGTVALYWGVLMRVIRFAHEEGWITKDITHNLPKVQGRKSTSRTFLTEEELRTLLSTPMRDTQAKNAFLCGLLTGLRWSDIIRIEAHHVRLDGETGELSLTMKKTKQPLRLPLSRAAVGLMRQQIEAHPTGKLFPVKTYSATRRNVVRWGKDAGLTKKITTHVARHTFATLSLSRGGDLLAVSRYLGHSNIAVTQTYLHLLDGQLEKVADAAATAIGLRP